MAYALAPVSSNAKENNFVVCDIEASKWINFSCIGFYDGEIFQHFLSLTEFFDFLVEEHAASVEPSKKGVRKIKIFAHFGGKYDFNFLLEWLYFDAPPKWELGDLIPRGSGVLCFDVTVPSKYGEVVLSFTDSSALLPMGLRKLTESFKVDHIKGDFKFEDWDGTVTDELLKYLESDCKGLYEVLKAFFNQPLIKRAGPATTIASQAMKVFQTFLHEPIYSLKPSVDEFVRGAYFGGRTEIFKPYFDGDGKDSLNLYDVNSLYPSVMMDFEYPTNFKRFTFKYEPEEFGFYDAEVEVPEDMYVPALGVVHVVDKTKKFIFPTGRFQGRWSTIELEYARSLGVKIIKTGRGCIFENGGYIFKKYVETLYEMRVEAQRNGDGVTDILCKLLMNSLYGKFGIRLDRELLVLDRGQAGVIPYIEMRNRKDKKQAIRLCKMATELNTFNNVSISAWVTSHSRIRMHKHYMNCEKDLYYTDTDSLYTTSQMPSSKKLGDVKFEGNCDRACFILPKTYVTEKISVDEVVKKVCMKGFDKRKIQDMGVKDFFMYLEGDLKEISAMMPEKFSTFRTALRKDKFLSMMAESSRTVRSKYDKRRIVKKGGSYDTIPLHIVDGRVSN